MAYKHECVINASFVYSAVYYFLYVCIHTHKKIKLQSRIHSYRFLSSLCAVFFRKSEETEISTTISDKHIFNIASSWTDKWDELAEVLKVNSHELTQRSPETTNTEVCSLILKKWLERTEGDRWEKLADVFRHEGYPRISDEIFDLPTIQ